MTAGQFAYTLPGNRGVKAWFHACPFETNFEHQSVAFNQLDSAECSRVFQVISSLSSDVFERAYVITTDIALDTNWEDRTTPSVRKSQTINQRLANPEKRRPLFGGGISAHAAAYNLPRHFGKSAEAIMKAYEDEAKQEDSR